MTAIHNFSGFPVTKQRALHKHTISCAEFVNRIRSNVASIKNNGTQHKRQIIGPNLSELLHKYRFYLHEFRLHTFPAQLFNYRLPRLVFQADETPCRSAIFWRASYQPSCLGQPFLKWQNENWTQIRNLKYTRNIYQLQKDMPTYWNKTRHLHYMRAINTIRK